MLFIFAFLAALVTTAFEDVGALVGATLLVSDVLKSYWVYFDAFTHWRRQMSRVTEIFGKLIIM